MGIDTSAVAWFGYPGVEDIEWSKEVTGEWDEPDFDDDAEVVWCGWYDSNVQALAVPGTVRRGDFMGTPLATREVSASDIEKLKSAATRGGFPVAGEPRWYFAARQS